MNDEVGAVLVVFVCCQFRKPPNLQRCAVSCASATSRSPSGHGALDRVMNLQNHKKKCKLAFKRCQFRVNWYVTG